MPDVYLRISFRLSWTIESESAVLPLNYSPKPSRNNFQPRYSLASTVPSPCRKPLSALTLGRCALYSFLMVNRRHWSRWGRGACEGWSLELGLAFRGSVVRQDKINQPPTWLASVNSGYLGEYFDRDAAMARVEEIIRHDMPLLLQDWQKYLASRDGQPRV